MLRSRYSLAYPQAQALADGAAPPTLPNPFPDPASPYRHTGAAVDPADWPWLRRDIAALMRSTLSPRGSL